MDTSERPRNNNNNNIIIILLKYYIIKYTQTWALARTHMAVYAYNQRPPFAQRIHPHPSHARTPAVTPPHPTHSHAFLHGCPRDPKASGRRITYYYYYYSFHASFFSWKQMQIGTTFLPLQRYVRNPTSS